MFETYGSIQKPLIRVSPLFAVLGLGVPFTSEAQLELTAERVPLNINLEVSSPAIADLNEDGFNDIIFAAICPQVGDVVGTTCAGIGIGTGDKAKWQLGIGGRDVGDPPVYPPLCVWALNGNANPPYSAQLAGWPQTIEDSCGALNPTVAIGDVNFDGHLDVAVGGNVGDVSPQSAFAFQRDGTLVPGWEGARLEFAPVFNAALIADSNRQGVNSVHFVDESTYLQRFGSLGKRRQCQLVGDPVHSSPAVGDVGRLDSHVADGIPDEIGLATPGQVAIYNSFGFSQDCAGTEDSLFSYNGMLYESSPVLADLDNDGTQDIIVQGTTFGHAAFLQVFASTQGLEQFALPSDGATPALTLAGYSSPVVFAQAGDGDYHQIVVGTDSGRVVALRYDPTATAGNRLQLIWQTLPLDPGFSISSSPAVADLNGDGLPEIVIGNDAGYLYILSSVDGAKIARASLLDGQPWDSDAAIRATAAIWTRFAGDYAMIIAGNPRGVFRVVLDIWPVFSPDSAQCPTFGCDNGRTRARPYPTTPTRGSVGGVVHPSCSGAQVKLLDASGTQLDDYYGGLAIATPVSDGRYLFELRLPGDYIVEFTTDPLTDVPVHINAGERADVSCGS